MRARFLCLMVALAPSPAVLCVSALCAADFRHQEDLVIKADETVDDDLYLTGRSMTIDGIIDGDVIAWAQEITINGSIKGSLIAAGQCIAINGEVYNARLGAQVIKLG